MSDLSDDAKAICIHYLSRDPETVLRTACKDAVHERFQAALTELVEAKLLVELDPPRGYPEGLAYVTAPHPGRKVSEAQQIGLRLRQDLPEADWPSCPLFRDEPEEAPAPQAGGNPGYLDWPGKGAAA